MKLTSAFAVFRQIHLDAPLRPRRPCARRALAAPSDAGTSSARARESVPEVGTVVEERSNGLPRPLHPGHQPAQSLIGKDARRIDLVFGIVI